MHEGARGTGKVHGLLDGVDEFVASIEAKRVRMASALKDQDYGMHEAIVRDPDGNEIYIGQPLWPRRRVLGRRSARCWPRSVLFSGPRWSVSSVVPLNG
jgi:hypothetical protein